MKYTSDSVPGGHYLITMVGTHPIKTPEQFTEDQLAMAQSAKEFSEKEIAPRIKDIEAKTPGVIPGLIKKAGEVGLLMAAIPEEYGGLGLDETTAMLVAEQFSRVGSFEVSIGAHTGIGTLPIAFFGTPEQKKAYLPALAKGEKISAYALTEPGSGSDALAAKTTATLTKDGKFYLLNGTKQFITNASFADVFITFAKINGERFTAFIVDRNTPGLTVGPEEHKMGIRGSSTASLIFEDARVPADNLLGQEGQGHKIAFNTLDMGRLTLGIATVGTAKYALGAAVRYGKDRKQFNRPIVSFGMVQKKLADMAIKIFAGETMGYRTTGLIDTALEGASSDPDKVKAFEEYSAETSIIKVFGSETLNFCADEAVQIHGGYGFIEDYEVERILRDSRINRIFEGTNEINRLIVPGTLFKRAAKGLLPLLDAAREIKERLGRGEAPEKPQGFLAEERRMVEAARWMTLYGADAAVQKYLVTIADHQLTLEMISEMVILLYAMDSAVARTLQIERLGQTEKTSCAVDITRAFISEAFWSLIWHGIQLIASIYEGAELEKHVELLNRLASLDLPVNILSLKHRVADAVIEAGRYPL